MIISGQKVFVPNYGAGVVYETKSNDIEQKYVKISLVIDNVDLYILKSRISQYRIRDVETKENLNKDLLIIKEVPKYIEKKWNRRYRENNDKIRRGNLIEMCEVIRDLYYLKKRGSIPLGESKILYKVENMLGSEISLVYNIGMQEALDNVKRLGE